MADLIKDATQLVKWRDVPALAIRVSIPNVNLLGTKGSILYGTGKPVTSEASINGETYQYAEVKALAAPSGTEQFILSNDSDGNLRYVPVINDYTDYGSRLGVLSASVANDINQKLHIANAATGTGISMGDGASGINAGAIAIGSNAKATAAFGEDGSFAIAIGSNAKADNKNIAIGSDAIASSYASPTIQLGTGENRTPNSFQVWNTPMLIDGKIPQTSIWPEIDTSGTVNIGMNISGSTDCVVIGNNTVGAKNSVAVGKRAEAKEYGTAIGSASTTLAQSIAGENSVAVGYGAQASGKYCVAIGSGAITGPESNEYYVQIGNISAGMTMSVGKYELMGSDGYIKDDRLKKQYHYHHRVIVENLEVPILSNTNFIGSVSFTFFSNSSSKINSIDKLIQALRDFAGNQGKDDNGYPKTYNHECNGYANGDNELVAIATMVQMSVSGSHSSPTFSANVCWVYYNRPNLIALNAESSNIYDTVTTLQF